jgi:hypothetical protein
MEGSATDGLMNKLNAVIIPLRKTSQVISGKKAARLTVPPADNV